MTDFLAPDPIEPTPPWPDRERAKSALQSPGGWLATEILSLAPVSRIGDLCTDPAFCAVHREIVARTNRVVVEERHGLMRGPIKAPNGDASKVNWFRVLRLWETHRTFTTMELSESIAAALAMVTPGDADHLVFKRRVVEPEFWKVGR